MQTIKKISSLYSQFEESKKAAIDHAKTALSIAIEIGGLLSEQKQKLPHGQFSGWISENFKFTARTARRWMQIHAERKSIEGAKTINEAYKLLKSPGQQSEESKTDTLSDLESVIEQGIDQVELIDKWINDILSMFPDLRLPNEGEQLIFVSSKTGDEYIDKQEDSESILVIKNIDAGAYYDPHIYNKCYGYGYEQYLRRGGLRCKNLYELIFYCWAGMGFYFQNTFAASITKDH